MAFIYEQVTACLSKPPAERSTAELVALEPWVRRKSAIFSTLQTDTVLDVIKHCEFITKQKHEPVLVQGEKGYSFYIILRGSVAVLIRDQRDEEDGDVSLLTRDQLGVQVAVLGDGAAFGELALLSEDCVRTASIVANESTDLVVIHRDLYNRSVARVVKKEYDDKYNFVDACPLFHDWAARWKKHLAIAMTRSSVGYDAEIIRQGARADRMYFILSGECKLVVDAETQPNQFRDFMHQCAPLIPDGTEGFGRLAWKEASTNEQRVQRLLDDKKRENVTSPALESMTSRPSVLRKQILFHRHHSEKVTLCLLNAGKVLGDIEFLLNLNKYHATAICTHETEVMWIHRAHFERLFRKRNPHSLKVLGELVIAQVLIRTGNRESLLRKLPFFRCLQLKLEDLTECRKKPKAENHTNLPLVNMDNMLILPQSFAEIDYHLPGQARKHTSRFCHFLARRSHTPMDGHTSLQPPPPPPPALSIPNLPEGILPTMVPIRADSIEAKGDDVIHVDRPLLNPREGIFAKLMQIDNPDMTADHLYIDDEEYNYLTKLRRRIAKEFQDFSMGTKVPFSEAREGTVERPCRTGRHAAATHTQLGKRMFPMLLAKSRGGGAQAHAHANAPAQTHAHSAGSVERRGSVRLPQF